MGNLKQAIADKDATKATVNFTDADQAKQQAYNTAVTNAETLFQKLMVAMQHKLKLNKQSNK